MIHSRFVTQGVVERIVAEAEVFHTNGDAAGSRSPRRIPRGLTLTENMALEQADAFLNAYLQVMRKIIAKSGGVIAEEEGDTLMIVFRITASPESMHSAR